MVVDAVWSFVRQFAPVGRNKPKGRTEGSLAQGYRIRSTAQRMTTRW